jgi:hypothetical protein
MAFARHNIGMRRAAKISPSVLETSSLPTYSRHAAKRTISRIERNDRKIQIETRRRPSLVFQTRRIGANIAKLPELLKRVMSRTPREGSQR